MKIAIYIKRGCIVLTHPLFLCQIRIKFEACVGQFGTRLAANLQYVTMEFLALSRKFFTIGTRAEKMIISDCFWGGVVKF